MTKTCSSVIMYDSMKEDFIKMLLWLDSLPIKLLALYHWFLFPSMLSAFHFFPCHIYITLYSFTTSSFSLFFSLFAYLFLSSLSSFNFLFYVFVFIFSLSLSSFVFAFFCMFLFFYFFYISINNTQYVCRCVQYIV